MTPQFICIAGGMLFVILTVKHAISGCRLAYWGDILHRERTPGIFWLTIAVDAALSVAFLTCAISGSLR